MNCPICGGETKVFNSRTTCESIWRQRRCEKCGYRFDTYEYEADLLNHLITLKKVEEWRNKNDFESKT